jgi:hypothetical protein
VWRRQYGGGGGTSDSTSNFVEAVATAGDSTAKFVGTVATAGALPTSMHGRSLPLSSLWITVTNARDAIHCFNRPYPVSTVDAWGQVCLAVIDPGIRKAISDVGEPGLVLGH